MELLVLVVVVEVVDHLHLYYKIIKEDEINN
jgi:hypothetical protein